MLPHFIEVLVTQHLCRGPFIFMHYKNRSQSNIWYYDEQNNYLEEQWKEMPLYESLYSISDLGRIKRKGKILVQFLRRKNGYLAVNLCKKGICKIQSVHILVMRVFKGKRPKGKVIHHKDHNTLNNAYFNLMYCTHGHNMKVSFDAGRKSLKADKNPKATFTNEQVKEMRELFYSEKATITEIIEKFKTNYDTAWRIIKWYNYKDVQFLK